MQKTPTIFLSYSRANTDIADSIDNDFKAIGITFRRDIRDVAYRSSIKDFMNTIGESDFVLMIISDEFLKSDWCMYEVTELLNTHKFHDKILPVILENANPIFKLEGCSNYFEYWSTKVKQLKRLVAKNPNAYYQEILNRCRNIENYLGDFFKTITEINHLGIEALKQQNYRPILDLVDIDNKAQLEEVLAFWQLTDQTKEEIALEEFGKKYPSNQFYSFSKAFSEAKKGNFNVAKVHYEEALRINPDHASAHYNLANLLKSNLKDYQRAKVHYKEAIRIKSDHISAHYNLANLFKNHLRDYQQAKIHYEETLRIKPDHARARYKLASLNKKT